MIALLPSRGLLATTPTSRINAAPDSPATVQRQADLGAKPRTAPARIWILAALALMCMLCEGVANDWSTLDLKTILGAPAGTAAFAYGTYAASMTIGRLLADRVSRRFGSAAVLRYGAAMGAAGMAVVALSPWIWMALAGWALFGLGLSGCVPQLFSAAGHADPAAAGTNVSRVAGLGYLGMLAGPAVIGWMTRLVTLNYTFLFPALLLVIAAATAGILRSGTERQPEPAQARNGAAPLTTWRFSPDRPGIAAIPSSARSSARPSPPPRSEWRSLMIQVPGWLTGLRVKQRVLLP